MRLKRIVIPLRSMQFKRKMSMENRWWEESMIIFQFKGQYGREQEHQMEMTRELEGGIHLMSNLWEGVKERAQEQGLQLVLINVEK